MCTNKSHIYFTPQFQEPEAKLEDIGDNVHQVLTDTCPQCPLDVLTIASGEFACIDSSSDQVLYRAEISGDPESDCTVLLAQIRQWVGSGAGSVSVQGNRLEVDPGCRVEIEGLSTSPDCTIPITPGVACKFTLQYFVCISYLVATKSHDSMSKYVEIFAINV